MGVVRPGRGPAGAGSLAAVDLATALGIVATVAFLVRLLPQPIRLIRTGVPDGVSPLMAMNIALTELAWLAYGLGTGLVPVWAVSLPAFPLALLTVVLLRAQIRRADVIGAVLWAVLILIAWVGGALGAVLGLSVVVQYGPQVWTALRQDDLDGISPTMWKLAFIDALTWGAYGLAVGDPALLGYTVMLSASAVTILVRLSQTAARRDAVAPAVAPAAEPA
jgi:uncharacterized protein with PQ loop repeat